MKIIKIADQFGTLIYKVEEVNVMTIDGRIIPCYAIVPVSPFDYEKDGQTFSF